MFWIDVALQKRWFVEEGLTVEGFDTNPDYYKGLDDTVAGRIDVDCFYLYDFVQRNLAGADLVGVVATDHVNGSEGIVGHARTMGELKGRRVGVVRGSYLEYLLDLALGVEHLTLADISLVEVPGEKALEALRRGEVDAVATWEPLLGEAERAGATRLFDSARAPRGAFTSVLALRRATVPRRLQELQALVRTWHRTTRFIDERPEEAFALVGGLYRKTAAEVAEFATKDLILGLDENRIAFAYAPGYESLHGSAGRVNEFLARRGLAREQLDTTRLFDARFIRELT